MTADDRPILIAYDGSAEARAALAQAAELFAGRRALVATVWTSVADVSPASLAAVPPSIAHEAQQKMDAASLEEARVCAEEGASIAGEAGLQAEALPLEVAGARWPAIVRAADDHDAAVLVVGSRGRSGLRSAVLGSVSAGVVHHCTRPVLVVRASDGP